MLSREGFGPVRLLKFTSRFANGTPVSTLFGKGVVTRFRPSDGIYEVLFQWDVTGVRPPVRTYLTAPWRDDFSATALRPMLID